MTNSLRDYDSLIYQEMMSHPVLFTHQHAKTVALASDEEDGILQELSKHPSLAEIWHIANTSYAYQDNRIKQLSLPALNTPSSHIGLDVLILAATHHDDYASYFKLLNPDGILVVRSQSLFNLDALNATTQMLSAAGFRDMQILHFPQPSFATGWRAAVMALKQGIFKKPSEKMIYNKPFQTHYYNLDAHRAALALPEFMRETLVY